MTPKQLREANEMYLDMFGSDIDSETKQILEGVDSLEDLEAIEDEISLGTYDCAEAAIEGRTT